MVIPPTFLMARGHHALTEPPEKKPSVMIISCTCDEVGTLPADVEPAIFDRNPSCLCEVCKEEQATEICTVNALREFATADEATAVCRKCHAILHTVAFEHFNKKAAEAYTE